MKAEVRVVGMELLFFQLQLESVEVIRLVNSKYGTGFVWLLYQLFSKT